MNELPRTIGLIIAYDGTAYCGWQRQKKDPSVQQTLEEALEKIHKHPVHLAGSGRTDSGVHAAGQAAHFISSLRSMAAERFVPALNRLLPPDVRVLSAAAAPPGFHARFDARARTYRYFFTGKRQALPWERRFALELFRQPDISLLNGYARLFRGEMDCSVFASPRDTSKSRIRYIYGASFFVQGDLLVFEIRANAFLWRMVRSVTGTLLHYEQKGFSAASFGDLLKSGDHALAGPTLPPAGLFLWKVDY
jgi:tRNA pseudouridine38-40 synthase